MTIRRINIREIPRIVDFINENYTTGYGSYVIIDQHFCENVVNNGFILVNEDDGDLMGTLFVIYLSKNVATISHFCVEQDNRDQGYGRELVEYVEKIKKVNHYWLTFKNRGRGEKVNVWYRPLNLVKCEQNGYYHHQSVNTRLLYLVKQPMNVDIRECSEVDFNKYVSGYDFVVVKDIFKIYSVYKDKSLLGIFGYYPMKIYSTRFNRAIKMATTSLVRGMEQRVLLKCLYYMAMKDGCIFCYIYETGIEEESLEDTRAIKVDNDAYIKSEGIKNNYLLI